MTLKMLENLTVIQTPMILPHPLASFLMEEGMPSSHAITCRDTLSVLEETQSHLQLDHAWKILR